MNITQFLMSSQFTLFLLHSYIMGWLLVAIKVMEWPHMVDLCHLLRRMFLAPIPVALIWLVTILVVMNFVLVLQCIVLGLAGLSVLGLLGYFVVRPITNKVVDVGGSALDAFHNKFCVMLYKK